MQIWLQQEEEANLREQEWLEKEEEERLVREAKIARLEEVRRQEEVAKIIQRQKAQKKAEARRLAKGPSSKEVRSISEMIQVWRKKDRTMGAVDFVRRFIRMDGSE